MTDRGATAYAYGGWSDVERVASEHFGVRTFRPGQRDLIEAVLSGRDAFGILPTGGGKSLTFQLPSLFLDRAVVVVSPLLALIRDQSDKLEGFDVPAARIDSTLRARDARDVLARAGGGRLDVLYVTPEGLRRADVREALAAHGVALFVVGPRLPPRVPRARRRLRGARPSAGAGADRDGDRERRARCRRATPPPRAAGRPDVVRAPEPEPRRRPHAEPGAKARGARRDPGARARRGDRLHDDGEARRGALGRAV
ncbi:MAG: DEAD/DEAH box helicase [Myxococcales bacterium]|nr:DEAD/DEAH box helicase [Myxococcales bacterium]